MSTYPQYANTDMFARRANTIGATVTSSKTQRSSS